MVLDNLLEESYDLRVAPFLRNGIVIDSCVIFELLDGIVATRFSSKILDELSDYQQILMVLEAIKANNNWGRFYVTPHILTETLRHLKDTCRKRLDYKEIVKEVMPIFRDMGEFSVAKSDFLELIDENNPIIEAGDISIFVTAEDFAERKEKVAILTKDGGIKARYTFEPHVLVMDYKTIALNYLG